SPLAHRARGAALARPRDLPARGGRARRRDRRSHGAHARGVAGRAVARLRARPGRLRRRRAAALPHARALAARRGGRALLRVVGARADRAARSARARHQPADEPVLLRATEDDGAARLPARAVDRRGDGAPAHGLPRRRPAAGGADPRARSAAPRRERQAGARMTDARAAQRPAVLEGTPPRNVFTRHDHHGDSVLDADVVVVGSGAGGATMAAELAEAGFDVIVLEEGSYYQTRDFTADSSAMARQLYRDGGVTMALGKPPILYQEGRAVGGSTVVNGGMSWRTPEKILERWQGMGL